jgi:general secretion pathway protein D
MHEPAFSSWSFALALLVGCSTVSAPHVQRNGNLSPTADAGQAADVAADAARESQGAPQAVIRRGTGTMINREAARAPAPALHGASTGEATFNFEGESVHAVVKAILGDMLGQNYVIAPGVQGTVTLATPKPVSPAQALNLLEMVLGWNNARMVYSGGRYNIVAADQALAGTVAPSTAPAASARGFGPGGPAAVHLRHRDEEGAGALCAAQRHRQRRQRPQRDHPGGTRAELENYLRTVEIFDVDWLSGMSVGVFPIQSGKAEQVAADLEKVFGEESKTPSAGMFRFLPLENANAVLVITPQVRYLDQIQQWLDRIDTAGGSARLFSYELRYIKARDLAERLVKPSPAAATAAAPARHRWHRAPFHRSWAATASAAWTTAAVSVRPRAVVPAVRQQWQPEPAAAPVRQRQRQPGSGRRPRGRVGGGGNQHPAGAFDAAGLALDPRGDRAGRDAAAGTSKPRWPRSRWMVT